MPVYRQCFHDRSIRTYIYTARLVSQGNTIMAQNSTDINKWDNELDQWETVHMRSVHKRAEYHSQHNCYFVQQSMVITRSGFPFYMLYRHCSCGQYNSKHEIARKQYVYIHEFGDGIEFHLNSSCRYVQKREGANLRLEQLCYCSRQSLNRNDH